MLKYSFMTFACPQYSLAEVIATAVRHGYDGVEPRAAEGHRHGIELELSSSERAAIRRQFEEAHVDVACIATSVQLNKPEAAERRAMVDAARAYCELAAALGSNRIRVFGGHADDKPDPATAAARVVEGLRACIDVAAACQVYVCLETHDFFSAGARVSEICAEVSSPWIRATWDTQHPVTAGETIEETEHLLMPFVHHVHFHDVNRLNGKNDCVPIGEGQAPIARFLGMFDKHAYQGYVSGEWFYNNGAEKDFAHYISALKALESGCEKQAT